MRYSTAAEHIDWKIAIDHYYADRMEAAYEAAVPLGTGVAGRYLGWYRMIEAEYITRTSSTISAENEWLQLEFIPKELGDFAEVIRRQIADACGDTARRFGWTHGPKILISILALETDAPWTTGRHGFFIDKQAYGKICLPNYVVHDPTALASAVAHEYAHVMTAALSGGRVPRWLDEAIAMVAGEEWDRRLIAILKSGHAPWLSVGDLGAAYGDDRRGPDFDARDLRLAYHQSGLIGKYLCTLKGGPGLAELMRAFANNSFWTEAKIAAGLQMPADEALREAYGLNVAQVFERAREWAAATPEPRT
jgi:hypothetical protein